MKYEKLKIGDIIKIKGSIEKIYMKIEECIENDEGELIYTLSFGEDNKKIIFIILDKSIELFSKARIKKENGNS